MRGKVNWEIPAMMRTTTAVNANGFANKCRHCTPGFTPAGTGIGDRDMKKKIAYVGWQRGARQNNPPCYKIRLVMEDRDLITAYPVE